MYHTEFYGYAKYYDIAFDFQNIPDECNFIEKVYEQYSLKKTKSFL